MDGETYTALRQRCSDEYPSWVVVASTVEQRLRDALKKAGIEAEVSARAKDPDSLLRKMVFKYGSADLNAAGDRAGARVVVHLPNQLNETRQIIRDLFADTTEDDKAASYGPDQFRYRGIHFDAVIPEPGIDPAVVEGEVRCEIQVRTVAEHAWSALSRLLVYKSPGEDDIPKEMQRRVNRLIAIVELFDLEARATYTEITERPEYAVHRVVYDLERLHAQVVGDLLDSMPRCDLVLTSRLLSLYGDDPAPSEKLTAFATVNHDRLRTAIKNYPPVTSPLVRMPEAFIIWERLDYDPVAVVHYWAETGYPIRYLDDLATIWGIDTSDI